MGVPKLSSKFDRHNPSLSIDISLKKISEFSSNPSIAIDFYAFLFYVIEQLNTLPEKLYYNNNNDTEIENSEIFQQHRNSTPFIKTKIEYFLSQFIENDISVYFFRDTINEPKKKETTLIRKQEKVKAISIAQDIKSLTHPYFLSSSVELLFNIINEFELNLRTKKINSSAIIRMIPCVGEADLFISHFLRFNPDCFGVISKDSDFLMMEGVRYIPFYSISLNKNSRRSSFKYFETERTCQTLDISYLQLLKIVTILGNDFYKPSNNQFLRRQNDSLTQLIQFIKSNNSEHVNEKIKSYYCKTRFNFFNDEIMDCFEQLHELNYKLSNNYHLFEHQFFSSHFAQNNNNENNDNQNQFNANNTNHNNITENKTLESKILAITGNNEINAEERCKLAKNFEEKKDLFNFIESEYRDLIIKSFIENSFRENLRLENEKIQQFLVEQFFSFFVGDKHISSILNILLNQIQYLYFTTDVNQEETVSQYYATLPIRARVYSAYESILRSSSSSSFCEYFPIRSKLCSISLNSPFSQYDITNDLSNHHHNNNNNNNNDDINAKIQTIIRNNYKELRNDTKNNTNSNHCGGDDDDEDEGVDVVDDDEQMQTNEKQFFYFVFGKKFTNTHRKKLAAISNHLMIPVCSLLYITQYFNVTNDDIQHIIAALSISFSNFYFTNTSISSFIYDHQNLSSNNDADNNDADDDADDNDADDNDADVNDADDNDADNNGADDHDADDHDEQNHNLGTDEFYSNNYINNQTLSSLAIEQNLHSCFPQMNYLFSVFHYVVTTISDINTHCLGPFNSVFLVEKCANYAIFFHNFKEFDFSKHIIYNQIQHFYQSFCPNITTSELVSEFQNQLQLTPQTQSQPQPQPQPQSNPQPQNSNAKSRKKKAKKVNNTAGNNNNNNPKLLKNAFSLLSEE